MFFFPFPYQCFPVPGFRKVIIIRISFVLIVRFDHILQFLPSSVVRIRKKIFLFLSRILPRYTDSHILRLFIFD